MHTAPLADASRRPPHLAETTGPFDDRALLGPKHQRDLQLPRSRMVERLMLLDAVLDDRDMVWLGTEADKTRYFLTRLAEYRFRPHELPHLAFGSGARQTLRLFPDKLPTADFRTFLVRHHHMWRMLNRWTLRVLVPTPLATSTQGYRHAFQEQLRQPLGLSDGKDLEWLFKQRKRAEQEPGFTLDARAREAADRYRGPRFEALEKAWRTHVAYAVATVYCSGLDDQFVRGQAAVEFVPMTRQYLHLAHLVGTA